MAAMSKHERIALYPDSYAGDYGFESVMVAARQRLVLDMLRKAAPRVVLEVGCGMDLLGARARDCGLAVEQWIIVEPAERFCAAARALSYDGARVEVIRGFFEDAVDAVRERCIRPPDFIVCSGLLNEVADPGRLLAAAKSLLAAPGIVHVNVPNALSLHRRLAKAMGLIAAESELTERNRRLAQYRVFDFDSLTGLAQEAGFSVVDRGGYFVKPFTHAQMESIAGVLSEQVLDGLWQLGRDMPELAAEIYVNLRAA